MDVRIDAQSLLRSLESKSCLGIAVMHYVMTTMRLLTRGTDIVLVVKRMNEHASDLAKSDQAIIWGLTSAIWLSQEKKIKKTNKETFCSQKFVPIRIGRHLYTRMLLTCKLAFRTRALMRRTIVPHGRNWTRRTDNDGSSIPLTVCGRGLVKSRVTTRFLCAGLEVRCVDEMKSIPPTAGSLLLLW